MSQSALLGPTFRVREKDVKEKWNPTHTMSPYLLVWGLITIVSREEKANFAFLAIKIKTKQNSAPYFLANLFS